MRAKIISQFYRKKQTIEQTIDEQANDEEMEYVSNPGTCSHATTFVTRLLVARLFVDSVSEDLRKSY
jgi:hypothetical protein